MGSDKFVYRLAGSLIDVRVRVLIEWEAYTVYMRKAMMPCGITEQIIWCQVILDWDHGVGV